MKIFETDWINSNPVFYNEKTGKASHKVNDVIDWDNIEFHPEGFNNYLDFGYSVFEQTPIKNVKFLPPNARLIKNENGNLYIKRLKDPVEDWIGIKTSEEEIWDAIETSIQAWEKSVEGYIIIPTSGGYDSRILNYFIENKNRIRSFTYGVSNPQYESYEVINAKILAEKLNTWWKQIELGNFHNYFDEWNSLMGPSVHSHGMYQLEFFKGIKKYVPNEAYLLSGILGDVWAGGKAIPPINSNKEVVKLSLSHGMHADSRQSLLNSLYELRDSYFAENQKKVSDPFWAVVESMRFKMILLSYLFTVPQRFNYTPWSPFLNFEIAIKMLSLPETRRKNRNWQVDFFKKTDICLEDIKIKRNYNNTLNYDATLKSELYPLETKLFKNIIRESYIEWINDRVLKRPLPNKLSRKILGIPKLGGGLKRLGFKSKDEFLEAYCAYLTLKPIEYLLKRMRGKYL